MAENTAEDTYADSERINKGIIQQCGDCKKRPVDLMKSPDQIPVKVEIGAEEKHKWWKKSPTVEHDSQEYQ
jgi:hypothetical protein